jgi:hypothetical protein
MHPLGVFSCELILLRQFLCSACSGIAACSGSNLDPGAGNDPGTGTSTLVVVGSARATSPKINAKLDTDFNRVHGPGVAQQPGRDDRDRHDHERVR